MKSDKLQDAIGEIRDDLIEDAHAAGQDSQTEKSEERSAGKRRKWTGWIAAAAACCVLAVGMKIVTAPSGSAPTGNTGNGSDVQVAEEAPGTDTSDTSSASFDEDASAGTSETDNSRASSGTGAAASSGEDSKTETSADSSSTAQKNTSETRKVVCNGPYGRISLSLPKGWKYEILKPDSKKLYQADYGIHFYPKSKKGYVEVGYQKEFGVCGTGLTEKTKTLAGSKASIGYYDGEKVWDFIRFDGKMEGVTAYSYNIKKWSKAQRKKAFEILDTLQFEPDMQSGAIGLYNQMAESEKLGLSVTIRHITRTGGTIVFSQYDESVKEVLGFGEDFVIIQKISGSKWKNLKVIKDTGASEILHLIKMNGTTKYQYDWSEKYGKLKAGTYRIRISVNDTYLYAAFLLR